MKEIPTRDEDVRDFAKKELRLSKNSVRRLTKEELIMICQGRGYKLMVG